MTVSVADQTIVFISCFMCGILVGIIFDFFRVLRRLIPSGSIVTFIEDLLFWLLAFVAVFVCALRFNYGDIRWFMLIGTSIGALLYFLTLSRIILAVCFFIIKIFKKVFRFVFKILCIPIRFICRIIKKPLIFTFNIGKTGCKKIFGKIKNNLFSFQKFYKQKLLLKKRQNML